MNIIHTRRLPPLEGTSTIVSDQLSSGKWWTFSSLSTLQMIFKWSLPGLPVVPQLSLTSPQGTSQHDVEPPGAVPQVIWPKGTCKILLSGIFLFRRGGGDPPIPLRKKTFFLGPKTLFFAFFYAFLALFGPLYGLFGPFLTLFNEKNIIFSPFRKKFPGKA